MRAISAGLQLVFHRRIRLLLAVSFGACSSGCVRIYCYSRPTSFATLFHAESPAAEAVTLIDLNVEGRDASRAHGTEQFYNQRAKEYFAETVRADLSSLYGRFLALMPAGGRILDAGSGSGRDTVAFLNRGYAVDAIDSSVGLAALSSQLTGIETRVLRFQELDVIEQYDGIWACASLLHVPPDELPDVLYRFGRALKLGGMLYASFKHGSGERLSPDGRMFTDMTTESVTKLIAETPSFKLMQAWTTRGEAKFAGRDVWVNVLATKESS